MSRLLSLFGADNTLFRETSIGSRFTFHTLNLVFYISTLSLLCTFLFPIPVLASEGPLNNILFTSPDVRTTLSVAWGDIDGDGDLDLAVGNLGLNQLYRNKGNGDFALEDLATDTSDTLNVVWGDADGDGDLDLAVSNIGVNQLYRNDGSGQLTQENIGTTISNTASMSWGDADGDGDLDLAVGNSQFNQLYRNTGNGSFVQENIGVTMSNTTSIAWGDADGDGDLDLAVGNIGVFSDTCECFLGEVNQLYRNNGNGYFTTENLGTDAKATMSVSWGDSDGDGDLDLIIGNGSLSNNEINQLYRNDGNGYFTAEDVGIQKRKTNTVAWGDVDGDGDLDFIAGNFEEVDQLYYNDGNGHFILESLESGAFPRPTFSVAWGDADGDGSLDLAVGTNFANLISHNEGTSRFSPANINPAGGYTVDIALGDADKDSDLDLAVGNLLELGIWERNRLYRNDGGGSFIPENLGTAISHTASVAWGDADGDGDLDLAVGNGYFETSQVNLLYRNDGDGHLIQETLGSDVKSTNSVAWGDADGDGDLDLAVGNWLQANQLYRNDGTGHFTLEDIVDDAKPTRRIVWGDADQDGDLDLAVGNNVGVNQLYRNDGRGNFTSEDIDITYDGTNSVAWGDVNGDGDLDLAVGNFGVNKLYHNDGSGHFTSENLTRESNQTNYVAWGDADGDGDLDLVIGNSMQANRLHRNDGDGRFTVEDFDSIRDTYSLAWGDVNGDGNLDLVVGNYATPPFADFNQLYLNQQPAHPYYPGQRATIAIASNSNPVQTYSGETITTLAKADFYAVSSIRESGIIPITYTLLHPTGISMGSVQAFYSPDGGGRWYTATATNTVINNLATAPTYTVAAQDFGWIDITNTGISVTLGDDDTTDDPLDIGFYFPFLNQTASKFWLSSNGWLTFHKPASPYPSNECLPAGLMTSSLIAPFWDDLDPSAGGQIYYRQISSDTMVIEFYQVPHYNDGSGAGPYTFEVILQRNGRITFQYLNMLPPLDNATIGIQSHGGSQTVQLACNATYAQNDLAVHFNRTGQLHTYTWDVFNSNFWGQSDNVVLRLEAYPTSSYSSITGTHRYTNVTPGPYQRPYFSTQTFPFRVRGTQVQVVTSTTPISNAVVYRLPQDRASYLLTDGSGTPFHTDQHGYLQGRGEIAQGDQLLAMLPITSVSNYAGTLSFDTTSDYAIKYPLNHSPITETTIAFWMRSGDTSGSGTPLSYATSDHQNTLLISEYNNFHVYRSQYFVSTNISATDGLWHHIAITWRSSDGQVKLYKDGVAAYTGTLATGTTMSPDGSLVMGQDQDSVGGGFQANQAFQGSLDDVHIWNTALTESQIQDIMSGFSEDTKDNLVAAWLFDDPENPGADSSGNDNALTLEGTSWDGTYLGGHTVYHTSGQPNTKGVTGTTVTDPGVQVLTVTAQHPLILFDLNVSLEWDAHNDPIYLEQLEYDLKKASAYLYDFTDGQVALGKVTVYQNADYWANAHIAVQATNRLRPFAHIGGVRADVFTETLIVDDGERILTYGPGQIRMGATWNRYGDPGQSLGEDWPLILAHELGHYLLYQYDVYLGLNDENLLVPEDACDGSAMGDVYAPQNTEFITGLLHWTTACSQTLAARTLGRTEWQTLRAHYPWLITPTDANSGPGQMPFAFTTVEIVSPTNVLDPLIDPTFYLAYAEGGVSSTNARGYLLRDGEMDTQNTDPDAFEYVYELGNPIGGQNRLLARGAQPGDRLCVFDSGRVHFGCEIISDADETLHLIHRAYWTPRVQVTPVNSTTFAVQVTGLSSETLTLKARIYPEFGTAFTPTTLSYINETYTGTLDLPYPVMWGHVQVWADEGIPPTETAPRPETIISFSIGGNPGFDRASGGAFDRASGGAFDRASGGAFDRASGGAFDRASGGGNLRAGEAPMASTDGQMILYASDEITFAKGQFFTIQAVAGLPDLPPGRTAVGQGYNLMATGFPSPTAALTGSISIQYLGNDVLVAGVDEEDLSIYFWDGIMWHELPTMLNTTYNMASAHSQGPGIYALFASVRVALYAPGWNLFAYSIRETRAVTEALLSISGYYTTVYGYDPDDPGGDLWKVYDVTVPDMYRHVVNDLEALEFGKGYWINVSEAITLHLSAPEISQITRLQHNMGTLASPPDTFYGPLLDSVNFTPGVGMLVEARIAGEVCGRGITSRVGDRILYVVDVWAKDGITSNCGDFGDEVTFFVHGQSMRPTATWDNHQLNELALSSGSSNTYLYLPLVLRAN